MTTPGHSYKAYHRATHTVAKTRQVVMLYEGAIRFLQQAREAMEKKAIEKRYQKLTRASEIIMGLQACLDFDAGGDAAQVLYDFYSSIDARIMTLHRTNDIAACDTVIAELRDMRDVWNKIDQGNMAPASDEMQEPAAGMAAITFSA